MKTQRVSWSPANGIELAETAQSNADLLLYFGSRETLTNPLCLAELRGLYPRAIMFGCSSGGQIANNDISDDTLSAVAMSFDSTRLRSAEATIGVAAESYGCGQALADVLAAPDLAGVLILSDGLSVNGSALVAGFVDKLGRSIPICGGLAGDGSSFEQTLVGLATNPRSNVIGAIGFYGSHVRIGHGSAGGWEVFGPSRGITRSVGNVLYELDGQPALDLYERYLGPDDIKGLPGTALRFPLMIRNPECAGQELVRTILAIDRNARSMTFAGDMPRGWSARLMRSSFDRLAEGAAKAGVEASRSSEGDDLSGSNGVSILISCIGRRLMMGQHVVEEIEAACASLPPGMEKLGFYSYGEISPHSATGFCELHNQTMTVMTISEAA